MSKKLGLMSANIITILNKSLENQTVAKLINYNVEEPLAQPDLDSYKSLFMSRVFPYPLDHAVDEEIVELRVYFSDIWFKNGGVIEDTQVFFDIIVHKNLYLVKDGEHTLLRTHRLAEEIVDIFDDKSIGTIGKLSFVRIVNLNSDGNFQGVRLIAKMMTIGGVK